MVSKHFTRAEFKCKCGGCTRDTVDVELVTVLERVREYFKVPVTVNSGNRCPKYNKKVGGGLRSQHKRGRAADIVVEGVDPAVVHTVLWDWYPDQYGLGKYETFTHIDTRAGKARW